MAHDAVGKLKRITAATQDFIEEKDLALAERYESAWWRRTAHFWLLVGKSFWRNRCPVRAAALAYTTLLALVPLLAIALSVTTSLLQNEGEKPFREAIDYLVKNVAPALNLEVKEGEAAANRRAEVVTKITDYVANIRSGALGLTSTIALLFVAIGLLRTIEAAFNDIWGLTRGRGWVTSFVQYWATITLGPLILVLAIGLTTSPHFARTAQLLDRLGTLGAVMLQLLPFVVLSLAFALFYALMPNTRVRWSAALVGGIVGGCLWQLNNLFNVLYVSRVITFSKIYGSLGILPLFLIGLYVSWLIVLFGAQVAYAWQNRQAYLQEKLAEVVNQRGREFVALRIMALVAERFQSGAKPPTVNQLSAALGVPTRLITQILQALLHAQLVVEVLDREGGFVPARPLDRITAHQITQALRAGQGTEPPTNDDPWRGVVRSQFERVLQAERAVAGAITLQDLVTKPAPATAVPPAPTPSA